MAAAKPWTNGRVTSLVKLYPLVFVLAGVLLSISTISLIVLLPTGFGGGGDSTTVTCAGENADTRRCLLTNVVFHGGFVYLSPDGAAQLPEEVLCSVVNNAANRAPCNFRAANYTEWRRLRRDARKCEVDVGVTLSRLNPSNAYHSIFEDMIPVYGMLQEEAGIGSGSDEALEQLRGRRWGLFITDPHGENLDASFWEAFLPELRTVQPSQPPCFARRLIAGTRSRCAHWRHCTDEGQSVTYSPPGAAADFRAMVLRRLGIDDSLRGMEAVRGFRQRAPRVVIVQRVDTTRQIKNMHELIEMVIETTGQLYPKVVDFAGYTVQEQVKETHGADFLILVHGGALANMIWLPYGAVLVDIYPDTFPIAYQSMLIHWVRNALIPSEHIHHPFESMNSTHQELTTGPLPPDCRCPLEQRFTCEAETFWRTAFITIDPSFSEHLGRGLAMWESHQYSRPCPDDPCYQEWKTSYLDMVNQKVPSPVYPACWPIPDASPAPAL